MHDQGIQVNRLVGFTFAGGTVKLAQAANGRSGLLGTDIHYLQVTCYFLLVVQSFRAIEQQLSKA